MYWNIRAITEGDLRAISRLFISVFNSSPWDEYWEYAWADERLNWIYQSQGFVGYIAIDSDRVIGAIMGHFAPFQGKKGFKIVEFFVDSDYQNQGLGSKLLNQLESNLRQGDYDFVSLLTARDSSAESFYLKRNYQRDRKIVLLNKKL